MSSSVSPYGGNLNPANYYQGIYTPNLQEISINQTVNSINQNIKYFDQTEFARLMNLLNSNVSVNNTIGIACSYFLLYFAKEIENLLRQEIFTEIELKGGALNHLIVGDSYEYADLDFTFFVNELDFTHLKNTIDQWINTRLGLRVKCNLVTTPTSQFVLITLPALPKPIDIQIITLKASQSIRGSTHSFNALRCPLYNLLKVIKNTNLPQPYFYPLDGFTVNECILDVIERRSQVKNPLELHEGLRSHCYLLTKDVIPRSLSFETILCLGLKRDYENLKDGFLRLENLLCQFIYRHYQADIASSTIFVLNYTRIILNSDLENKIEIINTLTGILVRNLGLKSKTLNPQECLQILAVCIQYFSVNFDKQINQVLLETPLSVLKLNSSLTTLVFSETNNWGVNSEFFDSELKFRLINKLEMLFPKPIQIEAPIETCLQEEIATTPSPASQEENASSSSLEIEEEAVSLPQVEIKPLTLNEEIDLFCKNALKDPVDDEGVLALEILPKIKSLNLERKKNIGLALQKIVKDLILRNKHNIAFKIYVEAQLKIGIEYLEEITSKNPLTIGSLLKAHVEGENTNENQDRLFTFYRRMSENTLKSNAKLLPRNAQLLFDFFVRWVEINVQNTSPEAYIHIAKNVMHFLLDSSYRLDESYKKLVREKCIDVFMKHPHSTYFIDLAWGYSLPNSQVETNKFWIKTSQYLIESLSKYPVEMALELALKLFNSMSHVKSGDQYVYDVSFLGLIKNMGGKFYPLISDEVEKFPFDRFLEYFKALLSLKEIPKELEGHLINAFKKIEQEFKSKRDFQIAVTDLFPKPILEKFPKLKELHSQLFKEPDSSDFAKEIIKVVPGFEAKIAGIKGDIDFYSNLHRCFALSVNLNRNPLGIKEAALLNECCKNELNRLVTLKKQDSDKWAQPVSKLVHFNIIMYLSFADEDCFNANLKSFLSLFKRALLANWLLLEDVKSCLQLYMQRARPEDRKEIQNILLEVRANEVQLFFCYVYEIQTNILIPEGLKDVVVQIESLEKHYPSNKSYVNDAFDIIMKAVYDCLLLLNNTDSKDERRLNFFNAVHSLPLDKKQFKDWIKLRDVQNSHNAFVAQLFSLISAFNIDTSKIKNLSKLDIKICDGEPKRSIQKGNTVKKQSPSESKEKEGFTVGDLLSMCTGKSLKGVDGNSLDLIQQVSKEVESPSTKGQVLSQYHINNMLDRLTKSYEKTPSDSQTITALVSYLSKISQDLCKKLQECKDDSFIGVFTDLVSNTEMCERIRGKFRINEARHDKDVHESNLMLLSKKLSNNYQTLIDFILKRSGEYKVQKLLLCLMESFRNIRKWFPHSSEIIEILEPYILLENNSDIPPEKLDNPHFFAAITKAHSSFENYQEVILHYEYLLTTTSDLAPFTKYNMLEPLILACIKLKDWSKAKNYASELLELFYNRLYTNPISGRTSREIPFPSIFQGITEDILRLQYKIDQFKENQPEIEIDSIKTINDLISKYNPKGNISAKAYAEKIIKFYEENPELELFYYDEIYLGIVVWDIMSQLIKSNELYLAATLFLLVIQNQEYNKLRDITGELQNVDAVLVDRILRSPQSSKELIEKAFQIGARLSWKETKNKTAFVIAAISKNDDFSILQRDKAIVDEWNLVHTKYKENPEKYRRVLLSIMTTRFMTNLTSLYTISKPDSIEKILQQFEEFYNFILTNQQWEVLAKNYSEKFDIPKLIHLKKLFLQLHECLDKSNYKLLDEKLKTFVSEPFLYLNIKVGSPDNFLNIFANVFFRNYLTFVQELIQRIKKIPAKESKTLITYPSKMLEISYQMFLRLKFNLQPENYVLFNQITDQAVGLYPKNHQVQAQMSAGTVNPQLQKLQGMNLQLFEKPQPDLEKVICNDYYSFVDVSFLTKCDDSFQTAKTGLEQGIKIYSENNTANADPKKLMECIHLLQQAVSDFECIAHSIEKFCSINCNDYLKGFLLMYVQKIERHTSDTYQLLIKLYVTKTLVEKILPEEEYAKGLKYLISVFQDVNSPNLAHTIGTCYAATNNLNEAIEYLQKSDLDDLSVLGKLVSLCVLNNSQEEAIKYFEKADKLVKISDKKILTSIASYYQSRIENEKAQLLINRANESSD